MRGGPRWKPSAPSPALQVSVKIRPSRGLIDLANDSLPIHLRLLAHGIILCTHMNIPRADRLGACGARKSLGTKKTGQWEPTQPEDRWQEERPLLMRFNICGNLCSPTLQEGSNSEKGFRQRVKGLAFQSISDINGPYNIGQCTSLLWASVSPSLEEEGVENKQISLWCAPAPTVYECKTRMGVRHPSKYLMMLGWGGNYED